VPSCTREGDPPAAIVKGIHQKPLRPAPKGLPSQGLTPSAFSA
jgi:hypothetical protein